MKKIILTLVFASAMTTMSAQTETEIAVENSYNKWSIELSGGFNKPMRPMTPGYRTAVVSPIVFDLGARYMFNNKFGLKADFGYNSFTEGDDSRPFDSKYYRVDLQGVANLGRIMNFETFTNRFGLLGHAGFGLAVGKADGKGNDRMGNFMAGVTGQIKLTERFALTGDFTTILNAKQNRAFDGVGIAGSPGFGGVLFNGTVGLTVYLGKNTKHADWVIDNEGRFDAIDSRFMSIENKMLDSDKDGVADYLDEELSTPAGAMVDTKGRSIDKNNNNVPDETEAFILKNYSSNTNNNSPLLTNNELITSLINGGYVAVYFDFDKSTPTNVSTEGTDFMLTYLRNNPTASIDIIGHADEIGRSAYNDKLSNARANNVKNTLIKANIDASRLNVIAAGEDTSVDINSENARRLVRRVTFRVK